MILTNYPERVETLLLLLTRHLDRYGLRVNQKKVHVWKVSELEAHRCRTIQAIFAHKRDNQNSKLVRDFVEKYLQIPQSELENSWNEGLPLLNRLVFSNLESLPKQLLKRMVKRFIAENYLLRADHKKIARVAALAQQSGEQERMNENLTRLIGNVFTTLFTTRCVRSHSTAKIVN